MPTTYNPSDLSGVTLTGSNLIATCSVAGGAVRAVDGLTTGKYYWEVTFPVAGNSQTGLANATATLPGLGSTNPLRCAVLNTSGQIFVNGVYAGLNAGSISSGSLICIAADLGAELIWFRVGAAGNWNGVAANNPATGVGGASFNAMGGPPGFAVYPISMFSSTTQQHTANFGATAFTGTVPSGFTSGWPSGSGAGTSATILTQASIEEWGASAPAVRLTQASIEEWGPPPAPIVNVTQVSIEEWGPVLGVQYRGTTTGPTTSATTNVITLPGGSLGDLTIVSFSQIQTGAGALLTVTPPVGWTTIFNVNGQGAIYRLAQSGDPTSITLTSSTATAWGTIATRYFNVDQTTPVDVSNGCLAATPSVSNPSAAGYYNAPSVAPKYPNDFLVGIWLSSAAFSGASPTLPTGFNQRVVLNSSGGCVVVADKQLSGTSRTGNQIATWNVATNNINVGIQVALKYAPDSAVASLSAPATWGAAYGTTGNVASTTIPLSKLGAQNGDLVCIFASATTVTITTPTGYTRSALVNNNYCFTKVYATSDPDPVLTNSGTNWTTTSTVCIRAIGTAGVTLDQVLTAAGTGASSPFTATLAPATPSSVNNYVLVGYQSSSSSGNTFSTTPANLQQQIVCTFGASIWLGDAQPVSVPTPTYVGTCTAGTSSLFGGIEVIVTVPSGYTDIRARVSAAAKGRGAVTVASAYTDVLARVQASSQARFGGVLVSGTQEQVTQVGVEHWARGLPYDIVTQIAVEQFITVGPPLEQVTQVALEHWATLSAIGTYQVVTQVALEHWVRIDVSVVTDGWLWVLT